MKVIMQQAGKQIVSNIDIQQIVNVTPTPIYATI